MACFITIWIYYLLSRAGCLVYADLWIETLVYASPDTTPRNCVGETSFPELKPCQEAC